MLIENHTVERQETLLVQCNSVLVSTTMHSRTPNVVGYGAGGYSRHCSHPAGGDIPTAFTDTVNNIRNHVRLAILNGTTSQWQRTQLAVYEGMHQADRKANAKRPDMNIRNTRQSSRHTHIGHTQWDRPRRCASTADRRDKAPRDT